MRLPWMLRVTAKTVRLIEAETTDLLHRFYTYDSLARFLQECRDAGADFTKHFIHLSSGPLRAEVEIAPKEQS